MNDIELALKYFNDGFSCSQAILSAFSPKLGLPEKVALKLSTAFGGGMARMGETCGAVTGAFMVIGLKFGIDNITDMEKKEKTYEIVKSFVKEFTNLHGSIKCKELLNYNINHPKEREIIKELHLFNIICPQLVKSSAELLNRIL